MPDPAIAYLVFDLETVADGELVSRLQYPGELMDPAAAVARYRAELMAKNGSDFIPYTFQYPAAVAVAKVTADFRLVDLVALDEPQFRPHVMTEHFWRGWEHYRRPTLVSFNGRTFDIPLLELAAFRYGLSLPGWFAGAAKGRAAAQPLQHRGPSRSDGTAHQLRLGALHRRPEPGGQCARQARKDGRRKATWFKTCSTPGGSSRSTITAAAMCWTPISCSCGRAC